MTTDAQLLAQLRRGVIEHCVLALLDRGPRYGFDLVRALAAVEGLGTTEGTIYPLLSRLRKDGLLDTSWQPSEQGPPRRYYELTEQGHTALKGFRRHWRDFSAAVDQVLEGDK